MMTSTEYARIQSKLTALGAFLDDGFVGTLRIKFAAENPDGSDVDIALVYPNWKALSSERQLS